MSYVLAILAIWGLSWIIADSKISLPIRLWISLRGPPWGTRALSFLECPACTSFWFGLATAILFLDLRWLAIPFALASCGTSLVLFIIVRVKG
jgi:hypothetical protein